MIVNSKKCSNDFNIMCNDINKSDNRTFEDFEKQFRHDKRWNGNNTKSWFNKRTELIKKKILALSKEIQNENKLLR